VSLLYRAIWSDSRHDLRRIGEEEFLRWIRRKGFDAEALIEGERIGTTRYGPRATEEGPAELIVRRARAQDRSASRLRLVEDRPNTGERWTATLTTITTETEPGGTFWVDIERVSDDPFTRPPFRAPRVTIDLVRTGNASAGDPRVGHVRLPGQVIALDAAGLAGLVRNQDRRISLAVFSHDEDGGHDVTMRRAQAAFVRLCGVAVVIVLPPGDVARFQDLVGDDLAVWGGAARLYLPNQGVRGLRPERHRYVAGYRMKRAEEAAADYFVQLLSTTVPATPPPSDWEPLRHALARTGSADNEELLELALGENAELAAELEVLRAEVLDHEEQVELLQLEVEDLEAELNRKAGTIATITRAMSTQPSDGPPDDLPDEVGSISEAIELARALEGVVIHSQAPRDLDKLEAAVNAGAWANATWRGLRALDAYARNEEGLPGGFWDWCRTTHSAWSWPATPKKLSMNESESVINSRRLREQRELPIDRAVDDTEKHLMVAHLKIAEGGGPMAPRVYFYDDTKGATGKIHVGYIGPHEHMSNTRTN
jgi:hypothetical protein